MNGGLDETRFARSSLIAAHNGVESRRTHRSRFPEQVNVGRVIPVKGANGGAHNKGGSPWVNFVTEWRPI